MTTAEQLDPPYPGDESVEEWQERRHKLLAALTDDQIRDMVSDAMDDRMIEAIRRHVITCDKPQAPEYLAVGGALIYRIAAEVDRYLEAHE